MRSAAVWGMGGRGLTFSGEGMAFQIKNTIFVDG
jgi:hypothetical protein